MTTFDVFLSHRGSDKPRVRELKRLLLEQQVRCWLDEDELPPGQNWQPLLEKGIKASESVAVLVSADGLGPWEDEEMQGALRLAVNDKRPVIPVLLPGCPTKPELPMFLGNRTYVDLRGGNLEHGIARLVWGITGKKPEGLSDFDDLEVETPSTPSELWSDRKRLALSSDTKDCYAWLHVICTRGEVPGSQDRKALWQAVRENRPSSFLAWQLATVARWSAPEYLEVEERFTPLQVNVRVRESEQGPAEKQQLPRDTLAEALAEVFEVQGAPATVILAPPGGGKSTLLRHYHLEEARRLGDGEQLVFYAQLRDYRPSKLAVEERDPAHPALAWLESRWRKETERAPPLKAFLEMRRLTLLLDGLNEIPRTSDAEYKERVDEWRALVRDVEDAYPGVCLVFACRPLATPSDSFHGRFHGLPRLFPLEASPAVVVAASVLNVEGERRESIE